MMNNVIPPGTYYNLSGITVSTISLSKMFTVGYEPEKPVKLMGFTIEGRRLIGSREMDPHYRMNRKHVIGMLNSDMIGYKGYDGFGIFMAKDKMSNEEQSSLLVDLKNRYINRLEHRFSARPYGCYDHASCDKNIFSATMAPDCLFPGWHKNWNPVVNIDAFLGLGAYYLTENSKGTSDNSGSTPFGGRFKNGVPRERIEERNDGKHHFMIEIPSNVCHITIWTQGHIGDAELFVRFSNNLKIDKYHLRNCYHGSNEQL